LSHQHVRLPEGVRVPWLASISRFEDHSITELAESQASDSTIMALAGHVIRKMLEHYSTYGRSKEGSRQCVVSQVPKRSTLKGYDTTTNKDDPQEKMPSYVIEIW